MTTPPISRTASVRTVIAAGLICLLPAAAGAAEYKIDLSHSAINFRTQHLGYSWMTGRFNKFDGTLNYDPEKGPEAQSVEIEIDTASLDTNWADRDKHLRSADFFDVDKFPTATFKSTKFEGDAEGGTLTGELTLHGVTKEISFPVKKVGEGKDPWGGYRAGFSGAYTMTRADFGMGFNLGPATEKIEIELLIEAIKAK